jgi:hypothetical protein
MRCVAPCERLLGHSPAAEFLEVPAIPPATLQTLGIWSWANRGGSSWTIYKHFANKREPFGPPDRINTA